ncbi:hypothetical protein [Nocardia sp. NPDC051570]|uniref:hypothetical protein n=1 Tax=Nocardia sp. NPDC051570 TaxID=3364324 RepID=UPI0037A2B5BD
MTFDGAPTLALRRRVHSALAAYRDGTYSLPELIDDLSMLINEMENDSVNAINSEWISEFRQQWGTLEEVYAVALDRGQSLDALPEKSASAIDSATAHIENMLK